MTSSRGTSSGWHPTYLPPWAAMTFSPPSAFFLFTRVTKENLWPSWCKALGVVFETGCASVGCTWGFVNENYARSKYLRTAVLMKWTPTMMGCLSSSILQWHIDTLLRMSFSRVSSCMYFGMLGNDLRSLSCSTLKPPVGDS